MQSVEWASQGVCRAEQCEMPTTPLVSQVGRKRKARKSGKPCLIIFLVELVIFVPTQLVSFNLTKAAPFDILVQIPGNQDIK